MELKCHNIIHRVHMLVPDHQISRFTADKRMMIAVRLTLVSLILLYAVQLSSFLIPFKSLYIHSRLISALSCYGPKNNLQQDLVNKSVYRRNQASTRLYNEGDIVEYISSKGTKQVVLVEAVRNSYLLNVINDAKKMFTIQSDKVTHVIRGEYSFGDLLALQKMLLECKSSQVERLWETCQETKQDNISLSHICNFFYHSEDSSRMFVVMKLMKTLGTVYFHIIES
jgi:hypothetical protein